MPNSRARRSPSDSTTPTTYPTSIESLRRSFASRSVPMLPGPTIAARVMLVSSPELERVSILARRGPEEEVVSITDVEGKARALFEARRDRKPIEPFTDADPTLGMADGYAVQAALTRLLLEGGDTIVGYKVGLTSAAMQKMIGIDSPDYGPVLGSTVYRDGDTIQLDAFIAPKVEAEIVCVMRDRLAGPGVTLEAAQAA